MGKVICTSSGFRLSICGNPRCKACFWKRAEMKRQAKQAAARDRDVAKGRHKPRSAPDPDERIQVE